MLREDKIYIERVIPYAQAGVLQLVRNKGELVSEEYVPEGISIRAYVPMEVYGNCNRCVWNFIILSFGYGFNGNKWKNK